MVEAAMIPTIEFEAIDRRHEVLLFLTGVRLELNTRIFIRDTERRLELDEL